MQRNKMIIIMIPVSFLFADDSKVKFEDAIIQLLSIYENSDKYKMDKYFGNCFDYINQCASKAASFTIISEQTGLYHINDLYLYINLSNAEVLHESKGFPIDTVFYLTKNGRSICDMYVVAPKNRWTYSNNSSIIIPDMLAIIYSETIAKTYEIYLKTKKIEYTGQRKV